MELILWRHAEAASGTVDKARVLTPRGKKQARRIAAWLRKQCIERPRILVSPAERAQQTARALTKHFTTTATVGVLATARKLLAAAGWPRRRGTVIIVGHQPELGRAVALAVSGLIADWRIRKGALWWISSSGPGRAVLVRAVVSPDLL